MPDRDESPTVVGVTETDMTGPSLVVVWRGGASRYPLVGRSEVVLGRSDECDVRVDHPSVSRRHATLRLKPELVLLDLGSANGTKVNRVRLAPMAPTRVSREDLLEIGATTLILQAGPEVAPSAAKPPSSDGMARARDLADRVAESDLSVILAGETGVGKEVMAERIHARSGRSGPLLRIHCASLPDTLMEGELFGYERGAFTGAVRAKAGLFELADKGTLLLDEVGELSPSTQTKLLRVLESRQVMRLGSVSSKAIDVRLVSATHRDLPAMMREGTFRQDLYFRLNGISIVIPPLRERREEIEELARAFLSASKKVLGAGALAVLMRYDWPGNIRELRNAVERAVALARDGVLRAEDLAVGLAAAPAPAETGKPGVRTELRDLERARIEQALVECAGNQSRAAERLGISRRVLLRRLDAYGFARPRKR
jgi:two-component system, NtrC family, response regulator AtoC